MLAAALLPAHVYDYKIYLFLVCVIKINNNIWKINTTTEYF